ncbi:MAG: fibronectin type III domain-containing protein, partial [Halanaerobiales bacterium]
MKKVVWISLFIVCLMAVNIKIESFSGFDDGIAMSRNVLSYEETVEDVCFEGCNEYYNIEEENNIFQAETDIAIGEIQSLDKIEQYGITWYFDKEYQCGRYANGDYWVLGPVTITNITPEYINEDVFYNDKWVNRWINGWEVNPAAGTEVGQGFGSEILSFDPELVPELPYLAGPGESIVKSVRSDEPPRQDQINRCERCLQTMAVLTVVEEPPPGNGALVFRPPYVATDKPYYYVDSLRTEFLPSVEPAGNPPTLQQVAEKYRMVQIEHKGTAVGYDTRPIDNFENVYGGMIGRRYGEAALRLMLNDPLEDKMEALINFTQMTIDFYHCTIEGRNFGPGGGHQPGLSLPLAWFAVMLGDNEAKDYVKNEAIFKTYEHDFLQPGKLDSTRALYGSRNTVFMSFDPYRYWNYVTLDNNPTDMYNICYPDPYGYIDGGGSLNRELSSYQLIMNGPWQGLVLAGLFMPELADIYNNPLLFNYVDRWFNQGQWTQPDPCAPSTGNMEDYGKLFGDDPDNPGMCILDPNLAYYNSPADFGYPEGVHGGRWPHRHENLAGKYGSSYGSANFFVPMWDAYYEYLLSIDTELPSVPIDLGAFGITHESVSLTWGASTDNVGVVGYRIYRNGTEIGTSTTTTYRDTGLSPNTQYRYTVSAYDEAGNVSFMSNELIITINNDIPAEVSNLSAIP